MSSGSFSQSCDARPIMAYALACPSLKSDTEGNPEEKTRRAMMQETIDKLLKYQQYIPDIHSLLFSEAYPVVYENGMADGWEWDTTATIIDNIPIGWMANWLRERYPTIFTDGVLVNINHTDDDAVKVLFCFEVGLHPMTGMPVATIDEGHARKCFQKLADDNGRRCEVLNSRAPVAEGSVDFGLGGVYELEWCNYRDRVVKINHISGVGVFLSDDLVITRGWRLTCNWSDTHAKLECPPASICLWEFFSDRAFTETFSRDKKGVFKLAAISDFVKWMSSTGAEAAGAGVDGHPAESELVSSSRGSSGTSSEVGLWRGKGRGLKRRISLAD